MLCFFMHMGERALKPRKITERQDLDGQGILEFYFPNWLWVIVKNTCWENYPRTSFQGETEEY